MRVVLYLSGGDDDVSERMTTKVNLTVVRTMSLELRYIQRNNVTTNNVMLYIPVIVFKNHNDDRKADSFTPFSSLQVIVNITV